MRRPLWSHSCRREEKARAWQRQKARAKVGCARPRYTTRGTHRARPRHAGANSTSAARPRRGCLTNTRAGAHAASRRGHANCCRPQEQR
eukprot:11065576-Alexandrium_andersonii.AAC.1